MSFDIDIVKVIVCFIGYMAWQIKLEAQVYFQKENNKNEFSAIKERLQVIESERKGLAEEIKDLNKSFNIAMLEIKVHLASIEERLKK